jgi:hypothetical protein
VLLVVERLDVGDGEAAVVALDVLDGVVGHFAFLLVMRRAMRARLPAARRRAISSSETVPA